MNVVWIQKKMKWEECLKTVVLGGYGNFGARICRALMHTPGIELVVASAHDIDLADDRPFVCIFSQVPDVIDESAGHGA